MTDLSIMRASMEDVWLSLFTSSKLTDQRSIVIAEKY